LPQHHFWEAHILAELACDIDFGPKHVPHSPSTTLRVVPLPVPGRIKGQHHAAHPFCSIHAWQAPFAMSRTRPI
jgi:hypothetical protein